MIPVLKDIRRSWCYVSKHQIFKLDIKTAISSGIMFCILKTVFCQSVIYLSVCSINTFYCLVLSLMWRVHWVCKWLAIAWFASQCRPLSSLTFLEFYRSTLDGYVSLRLVRHYISSFSDFVVVGHNYQQKIYISYSCWKFSVHLPNIHLLLGLLSKNLIVFDLSKSGGLLEK